MASHTSKNTPPEYFAENNYITLSEIKASNASFGGCIITGAPVEHLPFEAVGYWDELRALMNWADENVKSTLYICWGAQAALYHFYGVSKQPLKRKLFGIYKHTKDTPDAPLLRGLPDIFNVPHSRHTELVASDIHRTPELKILSTSAEAGIGFLTDGKNIFAVGHSEYFTEALKNEYLRDINKGRHIAVPENYFVNDNPNAEILSAWQSHAQSLFRNWLDFYVV
jgi:homoserine O-succinyltransferase